MKDKPTYQELTQRVRELEQNQSDFSTQRDHESHLKNVLLAIRDVNRLIARETDPKQLIQKICESLIKTRGYFNAWIALMDDKGDVVETSAASGFNGGFDIMESALHRGELPLCMRNSLGLDEPTVTQNPSSDCPECPLSSEYAGRSGLSCRLSYGDRVFGIISVSVPAKFAHDREEQSLFTELAIDLGYALSKLKTDVLAHRLNQIVTSIPQPISLVSQDYRYLAVNEVYAELFGTTVENIVGKTPADFFGKQVFEKEIRPNLDHVFSGNVLQYDIKADFPGLGNRWMSMSYFPYRNEQGDITGAISHGHDITERKLSEQALRESEELFRSYIEQAPLGIFVADAQGRYIDVNPAAERITGYSAGQLTSMSIPDLLVPETCEDGLKHFQTLDNIGQAYGEAIFRRADGKVGCWTVSATRLEPDRYLGFVEDITERKEREERIALLGRMLDEAPAGITIHNTEGHFLFSNRQNMRLHGYESEEEFLAINLHQLDVPESQAMLAERFRKIKEEGEARFEVAHFRRDGSTFNLEVTAKTIDWHGQTAVLSIAIDITERKQAEQTLLAERDQLLSLFNSIDEVIYIADLQTYELLYLNRYLADMLPENCLGKKCYKVLQDLDAPCSFCTNDIILEKKPEPHRWEYYNPSLGRHFAIVDRVISWSDGRDVRFEMAVDISAIKKAEAEGEKLQAQLLQAQKMESVGRLAGGVAHDFNNMLGVILGYVEFALEQAEQDQNLYNALREIQTAAQRSADLTKQLLTFARKQTISPKELDLNDTVESMMKMLRRLIGEDIDLAWQPAAHIWPVKMDPAQIDQILANLCVNARDAISGVGKLIIETSKKTFDEAYCNKYSGFIPGDYVLLAVSDNGCGMDKNTLNNLFEPFFTTKDVGQGTGLGLATVYGIVKQNSGFINVYSEPGQGSTFRIYLPRLLSENAVISCIPEKKPIFGGTETILLVEDEPAILKMTCMMLERNGYSVISAATPFLAMEKAKSHSGSIDLLMTDVVMPEMNGRNLAEKITSLYPGIRLLFMSGYTANVIAHQGVLDEGVAFIQKPFSIADLTEKVREVLDTTSDKT